MNVIELINKKKENGKLTQKEIEFIVLQYTKGKIPDYQMAAFLMAIRLNGLTLKETFNLTMAMIDTGKAINTSFLKGPKIDKHSTGGVGDKLSLILAPLVASCGVYVPMISGRGLGHTGGTLDKLESIPGFKTNLNPERMSQALKKVGCFISGQTPEIVPADKKMYALRDVTGTVDSIPLITASIMSKKLAEGIDGLVLDVKCGNGAFIKTVKEALTLSRWLIKVGQRSGKKVVALITNMDEPNGRMIGNSLEVWEAIETLKGKINKDIKDLVHELGSQMLVMSRKARNKNEARLILKNNLARGKAWLKFKEMVKFQGGNVKYLEKKSNFIKVKYKYQIKANKSGYLHNIDTSGLGFAGIELGAGRKTINDKIDHNVGFELLKKIGDRVARYEPLSVVYSNKRLGHHFITNLQRLFEISKQRVRRPRLIIKLVRLNKERL